MRVILGSTLGTYAGCCHRDAAGHAKGDALVTYQKDAAVLGALQLLNQRELRHGVPLAISRPVWGDAAAAPDGSSSSAGAPSEAEARPPRLKQPTAEHLEASIKDSLLANPAMSIR